MATGETLAECPACGREVDPGGPGVTYAVEQVDAPGSGQAHDSIDGRGCYFHAECPPERVGYKERPLP
ncbi:MAG TPA: hypothetical protein VEY87_08365 [Gaiellaceae bacterium]|nr:hypothetical protein [Gaiellaceae bacterium]